MNSILTFLGINPFVCVHKSYKFIFTDEEKTKVVIRCNDCGYIMETTAK